MIDSLYSVVLVTYLEQALRRKRLSNTISRVGRLPELELESVIYKQAESKYRRNMPCLGDQAYSLTVEQPPRRPSLPPVQFRRLGYMVPQN